VTMAQNLMSYWAKDKSNQSLINIKSAGYDSTPLHEACRFGRKTMIKFLIKHGALIDVYDKLGSSPIQCLLQSQHQDLVNLLLPPDLSLSSPLLTLPNPLPSGSPLALVSAGISSIISPAVSVNPSNPPMGLNGSAPASVANSTPSGVHVPTSTTALTIQHLPDMPSHCYMASTAYPWASLKENDQFQRTIANIKNQHFAQSQRLPPSKSLQKPKKK